MHGTEECRPGPIMIRYVQDLQLAAEDIFQFLKRVAIAIMWYDSVL
uniref:Uncharacterized protein n=1 Tax=Peronospora matthiolae TaxID=2874970 RepID=A0AAV1UFI4_9STRA